MPGIQIGTSRPPEDSPAFDELNRLTPGRNPVRRWSGRPCDQIPGGMQFWQLDRGDRQRYEQAGCSFLGSQPARRSLVVSGSMVGSAPRTTWMDAWCCQPDQVVPVFEEWVASPEYQKHKRTGLYFAIAMIGGIGALFLFRKQLGLKRGGERTAYVGWAANPMDDLVIERQPVYRDERRDLGWVENYDITTTDGLVVAALTLFTPEKAVEPFAPWSVITDYPGEPQPPDGFPTKELALEWIDLHADGMILAAEKHDAWLRERQSQRKPIERTAKVGSGLKKMFAEAVKIRAYKPKLERKAVDPGIAQLGVISKFSVVILGVEIGHMYMVEREPGKMSHPWMISLFYAEEPDPGWRGFPTRKEAERWLDQYAEDIYKNSIATLRAQKQSPVIPFETLMGMVTTLKIGDNLTQVFSKDGDYILGMVSYSKNPYYKDVPFKGSPAGPIAPDRFKTAVEALSYVVVNAQPRVTREEGTENIRQFVAGLLAYRRDDEGEEE